MQIQSSSCGSKRCISFVSCIGDAEVKGMLQRAKLNYQASGSRFTVLDFGVGRDVLFPRGKKQREAAITLVSELFDDVLSVPFLYSFQTDRPFRLLKRISHPKIFLTHFHPRMVDLEPLQLQKATAMLPPGRCKSSRPVSLVTACLHHERGMWGRAAYLRGVRHSIMVRWLLARGVVRSKPCMNEGKCGVQPPCTSCMSESQVFNLKMMTIPHIKLKENRGWYYISFNHGF